MDNEQEYITITQVAKDLGWNKATVYDWIKTLGIQTHRFVRNKNTFLHISDVQRLKEIKEKPWTAGPNTARTARNVSEKAEKTHVLPPAKTTKAVSEKAEKRTYNAKGTALPEGYMLAIDFADSHHVNRRTFQDHIKVGIGKGGLIHGPNVPEDGSVLVKDYVRAIDRIKRTWIDKNTGEDVTEREYYLTPEQQLAAIQFWRRHKVGYTECDQADCSCHT